MTASDGSVRALQRRDFCFRWGRRSLYALAFAAIALGGFRGYEAWRKRHLAAQLQQFVTRGEFQSAALVARRLLALDENNLAAARAMAEMAEKAGRVEAVLWRKKIAHLAPEVAAHQLALARTALRFGEADLAGAVLKALPEAARQTVEYHQVAGAKALVRRELLKAEEHFGTALGIAPENPHLALNVAILRLASADLKLAEEARRTLRALTEQAPVRLEALRALGADALARSDRVSAREWGGQLHAEKGATFADSFLYFQAVFGTDAASPVFAQLQSKAAAAPQSAAELITWLNRHELARVALHWSTLLPPQITEAHPVPLAIAESYSFVQDWPALRRHVEGKDWRELEPLRLAVQSHALHRLSPNDRPSMESQTLWRAALKAAETKPEQAIAIAQLAQGWGYYMEAEEAWWAIANSSGNPKLALTSLQRLYKAKQDTRGLLRVAKRALELNPNDLIAANNCASLGLLLSGDSTARRLALKLHSEHPANRAFAATYAYALHTEGKVADGLSVLERMKEEELKHPAIAAYYVVMLVEDEQFERARAYLAHAQRAPLLPEEKQLLESATRKLEREETAKSKGHEIS